MPHSLNKVCLIGNLGNEPEIRNLQSGKSIANLSVATSESWTDQSGQRQDRTEWHRVVIFDKKLGEIAQKYLHKGAKIYLEGQLKTRKWTDQSGNERHATEVVLQHFQGTLIMLDSPKKPGDNPQAQSLPAPKIPTRQELDDEIPF